MCVDSCQIQEAKESKKSKVQQYLYLWPLVSHRTLGDGFPTIVLKGHDGPLNLREFERFHHKCAYPHELLLEGPYGAEGTN